MGIKNDQVAQGRRVRGLLQPTPKGSPRWPPTKQQLQLKKPKTTFFSPYLESAAAITETKYSTTAFDKMNQACAYF